MELLWILLAIVAILAVTYYRQRESMTNADVQSALQKYGGSDTPHSYNSTGVSEYPIYGPTIKRPPVSPTGGSGEGAPKRTTGLYPEIYGPDVEMVPGTKPHNPKHRSDDPDDPAYEYNPDLQKAFPTSGPPQPFLTDFTKFQK